MKTITNKFKIALVAVGLLAIGTANAQITDASDDKLQNNGDATKVVRLIDNKGTIKYLQSKNGITQITSTDGGHKTVTTFQLGGTLDNDTSITLNDGTTDHNFTIDGINFNLANTAEINPTSGNAADVAATTINAATGYTILVRDQATGQVKKLLLTDLINEEHNEYEALAADEGDNDVEVTLAFRPSDIGKLLVFRNGAKLRAGTDYDFKGAVGTADELVVVVSGAALAGAQQWDVYQGDIFEYNYSK